jgi:oxalate decarboxylase/phosphoglucose isomerase-like protein (cupin superfamily)
MTEQILFPTIIQQDNISISDPKEILKWVEIQKLIGTDCSQYTTTNNGFQYAFNENDKQPDWHSNIISQLPFDFNKIKSSWIVAYDVGGYQDMHIHARSHGTLVVNLIGTGILCLYDPRPIATALSEPMILEKPLNVGDWIYIPGWLSHSTKPCKNERIVLVIDFKL